MGWAVHAARTVERIENCKSEKIKICSHGNLLENCSKSLFRELFPREMVTICTVYCWNIKVHNLPTNNFGFGVIVTTN